MHTLVCNTTRVARVRAYACTCMYTTYHSLRARTMHTMHCIDTLLDTTTVAMHRVCILSNYDRRMHNKHTMHSTLVDNTLEYAYSRTSLVMYIPFRVPRESTGAASRFVSAHRSRNSANRHSRAPQDWLWVLSRSPVQQTERILNQPENVWRRHPIPSFHPAL